MAELENAIERMMECDFVSFFMEGLKTKLNSKEKVSGEDEQTTEVRIRSVTVYINCTYFVLCIVQVFIAYIVEPQLSKPLCSQEITKVFG